MTALNDVAVEVNSLLTGFGLTQSKSAWLTTAVDDTEVTWTLDSTQSMGEGVAEIDDELVYVRKYSNGSLVIAPDGRGYDGTVAAPHDADSRVRMEPTFPIAAVKRAVNATIGRTFPTIFGVETVVINYLPGVSTYELPATTERILAVSYDTWGTSGEWPRSEFYSFDGHAEPTQYASGKTITLERGFLPGRPFRVTVAKRATQLDTQPEFTDTGLSQSARYAVVLGTVAYLTAFLDPVRLQTYSANATEMATNKPIVTAAKLSNDFEAKFQMELAAEATRLRSLYPTRINRRR